MTADDPETITVVAPRGPAYSDEEKDLLGHMIFTEAVGQYRVPGLFEAIGSTAINRIDRPDYGRHHTLTDVINAPGEFNGVNAVNTQNPKKPTPWQRWKNLQGTELIAKEQAKQVATQLLTGSVRDNSGYATGFYSSKDGTPPAGYYEQGLAPGRDVNGNATPSALVRSRPDLAPFTFTRPRVKP
jgi:hypothetical protein